MIRKVHRIDDYRVFKRWRWPAGTPEFATVNLIYGINGSGKSTLGCLLGETADDTEWKSGLEAQILTVDGTDRRACTAGDSIWRDIRVFNRDYVEANLRFDAADGSAAEGLLVLGKQSISDRTEREGARKRLEEVEKELEEQQVTATRARNRRDRLLRDTARQITEILGKVDRRYDSRRYKSTQVKAVIDRPHERAAPVGHSAEQDMEIITAEARPNITAPATDSYTLDEIAGQVREILQESATAKAIADLTEQPEHAHWVQAGMALHKQRHDCIFCTNTISAERTAALAAHFDDSVRELQERIERLTHDVERLDNETKGAVPAYRTRASCS